MSLRAIVQALSERVTVVNDAQRKFNDVVIERGQAQIDFNKMVIQRLADLERVAK